MITTNYGLLGGTLDNTRHIEAGARKTLTPSEQTCWRQGETRSPDREVALAVQPGRERSKEN